MSRYRHRQGDRMNKLKKSLRKCADDSLKKYENPYFLAQLVGEESTEIGEVRTKTTRLPIAILLLIVAMVCSVFIFCVVKYNNSEVYYGYSGSPVLGETSIEELNEELDYFSVTDTYMTSLIWKYDKKSGKSLYYSAQYENVESSERYEALYIDVLMNKNNEIFVDDSDKFDTIRDYGSFCLKYCTNIEVIDGAYDEIVIKGVILTPKEKISIEYHAVVITGEENTFFSMLDKIISLK